MNKVYLDRIKFGLLANYRQQTWGGCSIWEEETLNTHFRAEGVKTFLAHDQKLLTYTHLCSKMDIQLQSLQYSLLEKVSQLINISSTLQYPRICKGTRKLLFIDWVSNYFFYTSIGKSLEVAGISSVLRANKKCCLIHIFGLDFESYKNFHVLLNDTFNNKCWKR